uniref:Uncharacterized protein n=1 Tax=Panagrolaimus davidi TaxID=227884 RepID=A0A914PT29_9BILA
MPLSPIPPFQPYYGYSPPYVSDPPTPSSTPAASIQPIIGQTNQPPMRFPSTASEHSIPPPTSTNGQRQPVTAPIRRTTNSQAPVGTFGIYDKIRHEDYLLSINPKKAIDFADDVYLRVLRPRGFNVTSIVHFDADYILFENQVNGVYFTIGFLVPENRQPR